MRRTIKTFFKGFLELTRIEHSFMLILAVLIGILLSKSSRPIPLSSFVSALIIPSLLSMSAFAINDYFDYFSDKMNKRLDRPIVSGKIKREEAVFVSVILFALAVLLGYFVNEVLFLTSFIFGLFSFLYALKLKDSFIIGHLYVALSMAFPIIFGGLITGSASSLNFTHWALFWLILFAGLAREITHSIRDIKGDRMARKSLNIVNLFGVDVAKWMQFILYVIAISLSIFIFKYSPFYSSSVVYVAFVGACDILLFYSSAITVADPSNAAKTRNLTLIAMTLALIGFLLPLL